MVSLRRRKLLGLCTGVQNTCLAPFAIVSKKKISPEISVDNANPGSVHPVPFEDLNIYTDDDPSGEIGPPDVSDPSNLYDLHNQSNIFRSTFSKELDSRSTIEPDVKRRKQHRRRQIINQEQSVMRGVYFKNMKWQAAIKVDKKQIHLGTVSSQEEAAHLYDRAAFMCGREPNFELPEVEKQQLRKLKWEEFLSMTCSAISCKRTKRAPSIGKVMPYLQNSDWEGNQGAEGFSTS